MDGIDWLTANAGWIAVSALSLLIGAGGGYYAAQQEKEK